MKALKQLSDEWKKRLFFLMTAAAIAPLYFEGLAQVSGVIFVLILLLLISLAKDRSFQKNLSVLEKGWIWSGGVYAMVFILSFLLRPPYVDDGIWRLSSSGFILLLLIWFWIASKFELDDFVMESVAYSSLFFAVILLVVEMSTSQNWNFNYRYGNILADIGKTGFFLPLTAFLFGLLFLIRRQKRFMFLFVVAFILSSWVGSRTAVVMLVVPIVFITVYAVINAKKMQPSIKIVLLIGALGLIGMASYMAKDKVNDVVRDYQLAQKNEFYSSLGLRVVMFDVGSDMVEDNFFFGVGPNQYKEDLKYYASQSKYPDGIKHKITTFTHLHNQFLMDWVLSGFIGLLALVLFVLYPAVVFMRWFQLGHKFEAIYGVGFIISVWFILLFGAMFTYTYTTILYMLSFGAVVVSSLSSKERKFDD
ncbi:O-antigen ligase family protein [Hydrogenovibrio sp. 3SP14C1]|uniref:O-antigen ligase family protein n=1 Tax=Hydrogenovibrio sp. 3SP14C1 TaxID=3038774 RepID=UPI002416439E|nr:O-antigen ligase family protein [Hydrogenovibrio sp. 3SP14C1]MDG4813385.1 O-antigen ligase family protein [Hydrogenovibrio sp. 3SP14C1]